MQREHRNIHVRKEEQEKWDWLVRQAIKPGANIDLCNVIVHRLNNRLLDWDNMGGGCKYLLDALRHNKILYDDHPGIITSFDLKQPKVKQTEACTIVEIIPLA